MAVSTGSDRGVRTGWRLILEAARRQRGAIGLAILFGLGWTAAKVGMGMLVKQAIDRGIEADNPSALRSWTLLLGGVALLSALFTGLRR